MPQRFHIPAAPRRKTHRTKLIGLTTDETQSLFLTGLPTAATDLGLGAAAAATQLELTAALPVELRRSHPALLPPGRAVLISRPSRTRYGIKTRAHPTPPHGPTT
ncbi:hypothetical protein ACQP1G_22825 [Nocardia sp. CA-107356]|uniref:hypothetical protein n=1 Tax=Nocardia sp. CA-107356 TaxID=3239972 RepID=UPI003D905193